MLRSFSWYRRLACALTTAHLLIFAVAPFLETAPASGAQTISVDNGATQNLPTRTHDAETCPACVLLSIHAAQAPAAVTQFAAADLDRDISIVPVFAPQTPPQPGFLSRAPPVSIA